MNPSTIDRVGAAFLAVDWGTTNRRVFLIEQGEVTRTERDGKGVTSIQDFPGAVAELRADFGDLPMLLAGMVGSNIGWVPAPYVPAPAGIAELAAGLLRIDARTTIVPGVSVRDPADVMRGEEVQLLGAGRGRAGAARRAARPARARIANGRR